MNECCRWQAIDMATFSGIQLSEQQIQNYVQLRNQMPTGKEEKDCFKPWGCCDQQLFCMILEDKQQNIFMKKYPNIFTREISANG